MSNIRRFTLAVLLLLPGLSFANQTASGFCTTGGIKVTTFGSPSSNPVQGSYPGCSITVNIHGGGLATITDANGGPLSNPFTASSITGFWEFSAANGFYDVTLSGGTPALPSPVTIVNLLLNDPGSAAITASTFTGTGFISSTAGTAATGIFRCASLDSCLNFRNSANTLDLAFKKTGIASGNLPTDVLDASVFGGIKSPQFFSNTANSAATGVLSCAAGDTCVAFRNQANSGDIAALTKDSSDRVVVGGAAGLSTAAANVTNGATIGTTLSVGGASSLQGVTATTVTASGEIAPTVTGGAMGDTAHRFDAFIRNLDVSGTTVGFVTGSGTTNSIPKFTSASTVGNSSLTDNGTTVSTAENVSIPSASISGLVSAYTSAGELIGKFSTISAAITAAGAGGRVEPNVGTYTENINITFPITISGALPMFTFIQPATPANPTITIDSSVNGSLDGVLIEGVTIRCAATLSQPCGNGIRVTTAQNANQINDSFTLRDSIIGNMYQLNTTGTNGFDIAINFIGRSIYSNIERVKEFASRNVGLAINPGQGTGTTGPVNDLHVINSSFFGNFNEGIKVTCAGSVSSCTGNHFDTVESTENGLNTALSPCSAVLINTAWMTRFTNFYGEADCLGSADANAALIRVTGAALTPNQVDINGATLVMTATGAKYGVYVDAVRAGGTWDGLRFIGNPTTAPIHVATSDFSSHIEVLNASNMGKPDIVADAFGATHVSIPALGILAKTVINNAGAPVSGNTFSLCSIAGNTIWGITDIGVTGGPLTINTFTCGLANQTLRVCSDSGAITLTHAAGGNGQLSFDSATNRVLQSNQCVYLRHIFAADQWNEIAGLGAGLLATTNTWAQTQTFSGFVASGNTVRVTSDFTTANNNSLQTITGLTWSFPALARNYGFHCSLLYSQATAAVTVFFGIQAATNAPTNIAATGTQQTNTASFAASNITNLTTTVATTIVSAVPAATATVFSAVLDGMIENPASLNTINIMTATSVGADAVTIKKDSTCTLTPMP